MHLTGKDLISIQQVRDLMETAKQAQKKLSLMSQEQIDKIVKAICDAGYNNAEMLAKMANQETGFGKWQDKVLKNIFGSKGVYDEMKDLKTVGVVAEYPDKKIIDIAVPVGIVAGIIPSTNPTSTVLYKALIAIKGANAIVFSPHPNAKNCIIETVRLISEAAKKAGCPDGAISCITTPTLQATQELMRHKDTALILATGGEAMVKAAYSSGNPALGVGPGNGPSYIDKSANLRLAVKRIIDSKTFDNGTICASEQSVIVEKAMEEKVMAEFKAQGGHILNKEEADKLAKFVLRGDGSMNPAIIGKEATTIAQIVGLSVPSNTKVLLARESRVGYDIPYSREKLAPILGFYVEATVDDVLNKCISILMNEGAGHTFSIHCEDKDVIMKFAEKVPVSRVVVNTPSALGGIGATVNIIPALTLGCGAIGGSSTSDNVGPMHLINIKKVGYGVKEIEDLKRFSSNSASNILENNSEQLLDLLVKRIINELKVMN